MTVLRKLIFPAIWTFLFFIYFLSSVGLMNSADAPQFAQIEAIVEKRTFKLNDYSKYLWPDYIEHKGNIYTKRDPGFAYFNIPFYFISKVFEKSTKSLLIPNRILEERELKLALITYGLSTAWTVLMLFVFDKILKVFNVSPGIRLLFVPSLGLGSLFWRQSYTFTRQPLVSLLLLLIVWMLVNLSGNKRKSIYFYMGVVTGLLIFVDFMTIAMVVPLYLYLLWFLLSKRKEKTFSLKKTFVLLFIGWIFGSGGLWGYNLVNFKRLIKPSYFSDQYLDEFNKLENLFAADVTKVVPLVLFSPNKTPDPSIISYFKKMPDLARKISAEWFIKNKFEGIYYLSPLLFSSFLSMILFERRKNRDGIIFGILWLAVIIWILLISKYSGFFAANSFNTSYYLPAIPLLHIISAVTLDKITKRWKKYFFVYRLIWFVLIFLGGLSIYRGWRNHLTNYAPHVTGDHKIDPFVFGCLSCSPEGLKPLLLATFPNWPNAWIAIIFWLLTLIGWEFIISRRNIRGAI